jgi:zinc finger protein DZIP1
MINQGKIHVHAPPINSGLIQVRDSIDSLFAKEYIPLQPQFMFKDRGVQGGGRINWRQLMNVDLDKVQKEIDLSTLEALLNNVTYANLDREDLERLGDAHFVKLFRISQLTIEYLLYTQDYFQSVNKVLDKKGKEWYEAAKELESKLKSKHEDLKSLKKELKIK